MLRNAEFRRWRHKHQIENLDGEYFEHVGEEYSRDCKCKRCGRHYNINQGARMRQHVFNHQYEDKLKTKVMPDQVWMIKHNVSFRFVRILDKTEKGWLVGDVHTHRIYWIRKATRFIDQETERYQWPIRDKDGLPRSRK